MRPNLTTHSTKIPPTHSPFVSITDEAYLQLTLQECVTAELSHHEPRSNALSSHSPSPSAAGPLTSSDLFPLLPTELRLEIYVFAVTSYSKPPALLLVCRKMRYKALKTYAPAFKGAA